ncbi:MAG: hypothetical protein IKJ15_09520, partial [Lachnospiraceae bacterium]|nr:hypothetical protein [Lachnospiraceae bacterium]
MQTVFLYEPDIQALSINRSEIYRYLGYKDGMTVTDEVESLIDEILQNVLVGSVPKVCYKRFDVTIQDRVDFGFLSVKSKDLTTNLTG